MKSIIVAVTFFTVGLSQYVQAKDMTSRLGVGYSESFIGATLPSLAVKYYASQDLSISAALGVDTNATSSSFGFGGKVYKTVFTEDNLNFYMGGGAGLVSVGTSGTTTSGFELSGFCGVEFFFPGLDSIGINFQAGVGVVSLSSGVRFRTIGDTPLQAGMYFYF